MISSPKMNASATDFLPVQETSAYPNQALPSGTLTFLFTDLEGSTRLWESDPERMRLAMVRHDKLIESRVERYHGFVVRPRGEGDSRFAVFPRATDAIAAASLIQRAFFIEPWDLPTPLRVRLALHTGEADLRLGDYYGSAVNRCARLRSAAHGGQTLISMVTVGLVQDALPEGIRLRDLGEYDLKDLRRSEHIYQLIIPGLPKDFPPLKVNQTLHNNLPLALTSFIGRQMEITQVKQFLTSTRLLTITGSGGAGKTRLALRVGTDLVEHFPDGVWWVDLVSLTNPALVPQFIANTLTIHEEVGRPLVQTLLDNLRTKNLLLILDNCEHLLEEIPHLSEKLLRGAPHLRILATSREPLGLTGETIWCIPPLTSPDPLEPIDLDKLVTFESVTLFVARAAAVKPGFTLTPQNVLPITEICTRLEGIPLAIELAAARVKVLSASEIAARLVDCFHLLGDEGRTTLTRQQTLRAVMDWSYNLLAEKERLLFQRLSVFAGGWSLSSAESICAGGLLQPAEILNLLAHLVDKSLVVAEHHSGSERYRFLETIRQYARERLRNNDEEEPFAHKHAEHFLDLVEQSYADLWGPKQEDRLLLLEREHDNLRAALDWMVGDPNRGEMLLRMAATIWRFWQIHGNITEGRTWLEHALATNQDAPAQLRANALRGAGKFAHQQGDYQQAMTLHTQGLNLFREIGDKVGIARQLNALGEIAQIQGDYSQAANLHTESLALHYENGDREGIAASLEQLGIIARDHGQYHSARELLEESLKLNRERGDRLHTALSLNNLGVVAHFLCEYKHAISLYEQAVAISRQLKDRTGIANTLQNLAVVTKDQGDFTRSANLYHECLELRESFGDKRGIARATAGLAEVAFFQGDYPRAADLARKSLALFRELGVKRGIIISLEVLAFTANYQGDLDQASALAEESLTLSTEVDFPLAIAYGKEVFGLGAFARGDLEEAARQHKEALEIFRKIDDQRNVAHILVNLARTSYRKNDLASATRFLNESLSISRRLNIRWSLAFSLEIMGLLQRNAGNHARAWVLFRESLSLSLEQENQQGIANCLGAIAGLAAMTNQPVYATHLFAAADKLRKSMGMKMGLHDQEEYEHSFSLLRNQLDKGQFQAIWSQGSQMTLDQVIDELKTFTI